ncbi:unnamed protein product [Clavelina lepadiformis]|uniref:Uncharacterized protein n=1 Tax=Clavelina lepadiformis TaxID=159417 RepID=A0ABP0FZQ1_CLALP
MAYHPCLITNYWFLNDLCDTETVKTCHHVGLAPIMWQRSVRYGICCALVYHHEINGIFSAICDFMLPNYRTYAKTLKYPVRNTGLPFSPETTFSHPLETS